jgi:hypothetical protein
MINFETTSTTLKSGNEFRRSLAPLHTFALVQNAIGQLTEEVTEDSYYDAVILFYDENKKEYNHFDTFRSYQDQLDFITDQLVDKNVPLGVSLYWDENAPETATIFLPFGTLENESDDELVDKWLDSEDYWTEPDFDPAI